MQIGEPIPVKRGKRQTNKAWLLLSLVLNLALGVWGFQTWRALREIEADPGIVMRKEVEEVVAGVSKLIVLPEGETPTLATVADAEDLRGKQPFFSTAQNGDKVLLYTNAADPSQRKAYLYRPSTKQLLNVAPINIGGQVQSQQDVFSLEIRNGTSVSGLADRMGELMAQVFPNAEVVRKGNAAQTYPQSFLVAIDASPELARKVAAFFNTSIEDLPEGEERPEGVDLLLVLGSKAAAEATPAGEVAE